MKYLITGGSGSFGSHYVKWLTENTDNEITVFSRNEHEQWKMAQDFPNVRFILGDIRDREAVFQAIKGHDFIVHAAALKHVRTGEVQPWEVLQTNVTGTKNVADASTATGARMVLLSTDKAVEPINLYGASKMCAEKITLQAGHAVTRYGNVFGSNGSILHIFKDQFAKGHLFTITDHRMTRFIITYEECFELMESVANSRKPTGGRIFLPKNLHAINIPDLARAFDPDAKFDEIGIQPGEKIAELLSNNPIVSSEDCLKMSVEEIKTLIGETV